MSAASPPLVSRTWLLELLRREMFDENPSTPGGRALTGDALARDVGYRQGWSDRARSLIATLSQGCVEAGLVELAESKEGPRTLSGIVSFDLSETD